MEIAERFVLRTPLLPFSDFSTWGEDALCISAPEDAAAFEEDTRRQRAHLRSLVKRPEVRGALLVASPDLHASLDVWERTPDSAHGLKIERALVRYVSRMSARATPFGLFSGVSSGTAGTRTELQLVPRAQYRRHTRLDNDYLFTVAEVLDQTPELRSTLPLQLNSSLYVVGGRVRYVEARCVGLQRRHHLVSVDSTPYLRAALECARQGATRNDVALAVAAAHGDVESEEASVFVDELIDTQILVTDVAPPVTGAEPIHHLIERANEAVATEPVAEALLRADAYLSAIDDEGLGGAPSRYDEVVAVLSTLQAPVEVGRLFQVDMVKPVARATLGVEVRREIERGIEALHRITPPTGSTMRSFCDAFVTRYGEAEVPLVEALDEEAGIGFESSQTPSTEAPPLLDGLAFPGGPASSTTRWDGSAAWLLQRLCTTLHSNERTLVLTEHDIEQMSVAEPVPLPDAFSTMVRIVAGSETAVATGDFKVLIEAGGGPPGSRLSGRFCHMSDEIHQGVSAHLRAEEALRPEAIFAEVVHLPAGRVGNVLCRPVLREYEIPFLGISGAPVDQQIPVEDLLVSVRGGRVALHSRRLGREVVPRLSTAHTFTGRGLGLYRFLGALQGQDGQGFHFSWGPLGSAPYLPRVEFGRLVLQRARWRLGPEELAPLAKAAAGSKAAKTPMQVSALRHRGFVAVQQLRTTLGLPRWVVLCDGDNELTIDLNNVLCVDSFVQLVKGRRLATLSECLPGPDELVVGGPEGRFAHQLSLSAVVRRKPRAASRRASPPPPRRALDSRWLYVKLYTGTAGADDVLRRIVAPVCGRAVARGDADRWFFLRYGDPDWHLRVRLEGDPAKLLGKVLPDLQGAAEAGVASGLLWRVALDSYEPEAERYGGARGLELSEQIFAADSVAVAEIVARLPGDAGKNARWRLAVIGVDMLLDDLGLDLAAKAELTRSAKDSLETEFQIGTAFRRQLGAKFRTFRAEASALLERGPLRTHGPLGPEIAILEARSDVVRPIGSQLRTARLGRPLASLACSHTHMHVNRMLRSVAREQELVIYDILRRHYESALARVRKAQ